MTSLLHSQFLFAHMAHLAIWYSAHVSAHMPFSQWHTGSPQEAQPAWTCLWGLKTLCMHSSSTTTRSCTSKSACQSCPSHVNRPATKSVWIGRRACQLTSREINRGPAQQRGHSTVPQGISLISKSARERSVSRVARRGQAVAGLGCHGPKLPLPQFSQLVNCKHGLQLCCTRRKCHWRLLAVDSARHATPRIGATGACLLLIAQGMPRPEKVPPVPVCR